jgi:peroxiredoxin (alkyl hydroperoxide reductase subunit C)
VLSRVRSSVQPTTFATPSIESNTDNLPELSLADYTAKKQWVVLGFVPMAWTFVCPTEILAFSDRAADFAARGASVVFASTDSEYSLLAWTAASKRDGGLGNINIPLLSDKNHSISKDYGVLIEEEGIALRGLFLIDPAGVVRQITVNDLPVGRSVDETLRLIDAFQFTDKYGEVCSIRLSTSGSIN